MLPRQPNQSIIDGIRCLQAVVNQERPAGISEIAKELHLETTRVHRLLRTLAHMGLIDQTKSRKYLPGPALPVLAAQTLHAIRFTGAPVQILHDLFKRLNLIVALGVRWQRSVSYLYHAEPGEAIQDVVGNYRAWPAEHSGIGVFLLACLSDAEIRELYAGSSLSRANLQALLTKTTKAREDGYSFVPTKGGHKTLAVPIPGNPYMALGVSGKIAAGSVRKLLPALQETAAALEKAFAARHQD